MANMKKRERHLAKERGRRDAAYRERQLQKRREQGLASLLDTGVEEGSSARGLRGVAEAARRAYVEPKAGTTSANVHAVGPWEDPWPSKDTSAMDALLKAARELGEKVATAKEAAVLKAFMGKESPWGNDETGADKFPLLPEPMYFDYVAGVPVGAAPLQQGDAVTHVLPGGEKLVGRVVDARVNIGTAGIKSSVTMLVDHIVTEGEEVGPHPHLASGVDGGNLE